MKSWTLSRILKLSTYRSGGCSCIQVSKFDRVATNPCIDLQKDMVNKITREGKHTQFWRAGGVLPTNCDMHCKQRAQLRKPNSDPIEGERVLINPKDSRIWVTKSTCNRNRCSLVCGIISSSPSLHSQRNVSICHYMGDLDRV